MELLAMKTAVELVEQQYAFSQRRACSLLMVAVSSVRYQARSSEEDLWRVWWSWPERSHGSDIGDCKCCCAVSESW